jgi:hypothetical protein
LPAQVFALKAMVEDEAFLSDPEGQGYAARINQHLPPTVRAGAQRCLPAPASWPTRRPSGRAGSAGRHMRSHLPPLGPPRQLPAPRGAGAGGRRAEGQPQVQRAPHVLPARVRVLAAAVADRWAAGPCCAAPPWLPPPAGLSTLRAQDAWRQEGLAGGPSAAPGGACQRGEGGRGEGSGWRRAAAAASGAGVSPACRGGQGPAAGGQGPYRR